jgi:hypothetical protein
VKSSRAAWEERGWLGSGHLDAQAAQPGSLAALTSRVSRIQTRTEHGSH